MTSIRSVGLIGFGEFGKLLARLLPTELDVLVWTRSDHRLSAGVRRDDLDSVAACDVVVLCVPLGSYQTILGKLVNLLPAESLLVDVCSVKVKPTQLIKQFLPKHTNLLITHPLFGPQTIGDGVAGKRIIVTEAQGDRAQEVLNWCKNLDLEVVSMTSEAHDQEMARVHALTFFIARGLHNMGVAAGEFTPPSYQSLLELVRLDQAHSQALFETMELGNPFAADVRKNLLAVLRTIDKNLSVQDQ